MDNRKIKRPIRSGQTNCRFRRRRLMGAMTRLRTDFLITWRRGTSWRRVWQILRKKPRIELLRDRMGT